MTDVSGSDAILTPTSIIAEKWEVLSVIGKGAFGVIVAVKNLRTNECEAMKLEIDDPSTKGGLMQEIRSLQTLGGMASSIVSSALLPLRVSLSLPPDILGKALELEVHGHEFVRREHCGTEWPAGGILCCHCVLHWSQGTSLLGGHPHERIHP